MLDLGISLFFYHTVDYSASFFTPGRLVVVALTLSLVPGRSVVVACTLSLVPGRFVVDTGSGCVGFSGFLDSGRLVAGVFLAGLLLGLLDAAGCGL